MAVLEAGAPPASIGAPRRQRHRRRDRWTPYALIAPTAVLMGVFLIYPIGNVVYFSLYHYNVTKPCLLYTSPSPRDGLLSRMPSSA